MRVRKTAYQATPPFLCAPPFALFFMLTVEQKRSMTCRLGLCPYSRGQYLTPYQQTGSAPIVSIVGPESDDMIGCMLDFHSILNRYNIKIKFFREIFIYSLFNRAERLVGAALIGLYETEVCLRM